MVVTWTCGTLLCSQVNNVSPVKRLTQSEVKRLLRAGCPKQAGPVIKCLKQNAEPPSSVVSKNNLGTADDQAAATIMRRAPSSSGISGPVSPSPSLSARFAGKIGNISPVVSRLVRTASQSSTTGGISASDLQQLGREYSLVS